MESYYLGLDGGGTKTTAVIIDDAGRECGRGAGGAGNLAHNTDAALAESVRAALVGACAEAGVSASSARFAGVCAGMAGYSAPARRRDFAALLPSLVPARAYRIEPDYVIAYWGAAAGAPGIVVIAGTGAVGYGRDAQGGTCREDGLGYLLGDRGSGFELGLRVVRHALTQWNEGRTDALAQAVSTGTGAHNREEVLQWLYSGFHPARVAALAPAIGALAEAGEPLARTHVAITARHLRHIVAVIRHRLQLPPDIPVYPLGGLWNLGAFLRSEFAEPQWSVPHSELARAMLPASPDLSSNACLTIAVPLHDAAYGAALLAQKAKCSGDL